MVGITGADASGKSALASALHAELAARGDRCQLVHVDDFHRPRAARYAGDLPETDKYLRQSVDLDRLVREVLAPVRQQGRLRLTLRHLDIDTDGWSVDRTYVVGELTIVLVEGVFLLRPPVREHLDRIVFLDVEDDELVSRGTVRDSGVHGDRAEDKFRRKFLPAQHVVFSAHPPRDHADVIIDNNDWMSPTVTLWNLP